MSAAQGKPAYYKLAGFAVALVGLRLFTVQKVVDGVAKPSLGWFGIILGVILMGLGWGIYDVGRNITRHQKAARKGKGSE